MGGRVIAVVFGSGGHTGEMLRLINGIVKDVNRPSFAFLSSDDWIAERVAKDFHIKTVKITRPRKVNQSMISAVLSTLWTLSRCIYLILCGKVPRVDLILCNGPGICVCVAVAFHIARLVTFGYRQCPRFIYVESFARTKTLSRTGSLMQYLSDQVIVQWPGLERKVEKNHWWIVPCDYYGGPLI